MLSTIVITAADTPVTNLIIEILLSCCANLALCSYHLQFLRSINWSIADLFLSYRPSTILLESFNLIQN